MDIFIARQGIYNKKEKVVAYELLYRNSLNNRFDDSIQEEIATYKVIENISSFGLDILTDNRKAFVNFSEKLIKKNIATLLPKDKVVIEVLETVNPSKEIIDRLKFLKEVGYSIALDDVIEEEHIINFRDVIDIVKVDFLLSSKESRKKIANICKDLNIEMLAEKIETLEELKEAQDLGYDYYQGYYYSKPSIFLGKDISIKNTSIFSLLVELIREDYDLDKVEYIIKTDIALTYKFLRFINSAYFNFLYEIKSIKQAIILIGREELRKWLSILSVVEISSGKSDEYAKNIIIRAKFCEEIASICNEDASSAFMVGLFSNLHLMIEKDVEYLVENLPVNMKIKKALLGEDNIFRNILELSLAYEMLDNENITKQCNKLKVNKGALWNSYCKAIEWSKNIGN